MFILYSFIILHTFKYSIYSTKFIYNMQVLMNAISSK